MFSLDKSTVLYRPQLPLLFGMCKAELRCTDILLHDSLFQLYGVCSLLPPLSIYQVQITEDSVYCTHRPLMYRYEYPYHTGTY